MNVAQAVAEMSDDYDAELRQLSTVTLLERVHAGSDEARSTLYERYLPNPGRLRRKRMP